MKEVTVPLQAGHRTTDSFRGNTSPKPRLCTPKPTATPFSTQGKL